MADRAVIPRCPNCGCDEVYEWDKVDVRYRVVNATGSNLSGFELVYSDTGGDVNWDTSEFDMLWCGCCDFACGDKDAFIPGTESFAERRRASEVALADRRDVAQLEEEGLEDDEELPQLTDEEAMGEIYAILDGQEWSPSTAEEIRDVVNKTDRRVRGPEAKTT
jgi:hypothetical protein